MDNRGADTTTAQVSFTEALARFERSSPMAYVAYRPDDTIVLDGSFAMTDLAALVDAWRGDGAS